MPICAFDLNGYHWAHFDATDPDLPAWLEQRVPELPRSTLLQSETRPRCDVFGDGLILNLRGVNLNEGHDAFDMVSLRMWVVADLIVTVRFRKIFALDDIRRECEAGRAPDSVLEFLVQLVTRLTDRIEATVLHGIEVSDDIEEAVFAEEVDVSAQIGPLRRETIGLRRYVGPQRDALQKLATTELPFMEGPARPHLREAMNRTMIAIEGLASTHDRLIAVQDHLDTQQAYRMGRNGYVLSIVAAVFLPLGFLTGLFGMNVAGLPGTEWPHAFAFLCIAMSGVAALLLVWFRLKDWI